MTYVVTEPCFGCKYTDCVTVCPCDCFREGEKMLFIDPAECIDCDACVSECPVEAIFYEDNVPAQWNDFVALNAEMARKCPPIVMAKEPLVEKPRQ
jgi:ferredoxin